MKNLHNFHEYEKFMSQLFINKPKFAKKWQKNLNECKQIHKLRVNLDLVQFDEICENDFEDEKVQNEDQEDKKYNNQNCEKCNIMNKCTAM